jgi:hypothetical protein
MVQPWVCEHAGKARPYHLMTLLGRRIGDQGQKANRLPKLAGDSCIEHFR